MTDKVPWKLVGLSELREYWNPLHEIYNYLNKFDRIMYVHSCCGDMLAPNSTKFSYSVSFLVVHKRLNRTL